MAPGSAAKRLLRFFFPRGEAHTGPQGSRVQAGALHNRSLGKWGEDRAAAYLAKHGYTVLERNYRCRFGEVDIVAAHENVLVFVEVKTRRSRAFGTAGESVPARKQKKISLVALEYIQRNRMEDQNARFDVVTVECTENGHTVQLIRDAFTLRSG